MRLRPRGYGVSVVPALRPFTVDHFRVYASRLVFDDGKCREPESFQLDFARDVFNGDKECLLVVPEGNGKTSLVAELALYGCDWAPDPWIPVGASSRDQAKTLYTQAKGFVDRTPGLKRRFRCFDGYRAIKPLNATTGKPRPGRGIEICPWDPDTNDGVIPYPYFICDELHRHPDLSLWRLWTGKCRKRGAQGIGISTAGEPGSEFEELRDRIRQLAVTSKKRYGGTHYRGGNLVMYEFRLDKPELCMKAKEVAKVNPLSTITAEMLAEDMESPTFDIGDWKRLKCNLPARSVHAAITDDEWAYAASVETEIPEGARIDVGLDIGWKYDTTALVPLWRAPDYLLLDEAIVIVPPRDGTSLHPDRIKEKFIRLNERNPIDAVVMDTTDGEDIMSWLEDNLGVAVIDRQQSNDLHVLDYKNFMRGLRNARSVKPPGKDEAKHSMPLRHVERCPRLTRHSMNAVARRLPRGDFRFDRPEQSRNAKKQDRRVIDALTAAGMVVTNSVASVPTLDVAANIW